jgi:hypothetical protein
MQGRGGHRWGDNSTTQTNSAWSGLTIKFHDPMDCPSHLEKDVHDGVGLRVGSHDLDILVSWDTSQI